MRSKNKNNKTAKVQKSSTHTMRIQKEPQTPQRQFFHGNRTMDTRLQAMKTFMKFKNFSPSVCCLAGASPRKPNAGPSTAFRAEAGAFAVSFRQENMNVR